MSDKKLLNESTIRRFMKLAHVNKHVDSFLAEQAAPEEEEVDMGEPPAEEPMADMDADMGDMGDMEDDMGDMEDDMGEADVSLTEEEARLLISLGERLSQAMDDDMEDEPMDDMEDEPMDDMEDMDAAEEPEIPEEEEEEDPGMRADSAVYENKDALVQEVLKRVTKRILAKRG